MSIQKMAESVRGKQGREVVQRLLVDIGTRYPEVVLVGADSFRSIRGLDFEREFPDRSYNVGIAEQNAVGIAAGLAISGKLPVVLLFGFTLARVLEQVKSSVCYPDLDVRLITTATGLDMGEGGVTHHCTEDIGLLRTLANMTIIQAASGLETVLAMHALFEQIRGPAYLRSTRQTFCPDAERATEEYYGSGREFRIGDPIVLQEGTDLALLASGLTVGVALQAANRLLDEGVSASVVNIHTIKPLRQGALLPILDRFPAAVAIEDHNVLGGLGEAIAAIAAERCSTRVLRIGIQDEYCAIGKPSELCAHHGLCTDRVVELTTRFLSG